MKKTSHKQDINRPRSRQTNVQNLACISKALPLFSKQHLNNT